MRFLLAAQRKNLAAVRLEQILLLAVRCLLLLLLLVLAMAASRRWAEAVWRWFAPRPAWPSSAAASARTRSSSWTARSAWASRPATPTASRRPAPLAAQIVSESSGGDGFSVVLMAAPPRAIVPGRRRRPGSPRKVAKVEIDALRLTARQRRPGRHPQHRRETCCEASPRQVRRQGGLLPHRPAAIDLDRRASPAPCPPRVQKIQARAKRPSSSTSARTAPTTSPSTGLALAEPWPSPAAKTLLHGHAAQLRRHARPTCGVRLLVGKAERRQMPELREVRGRGDREGDQGRRTGRVAFEYKFPDPGDYVVQVAGRPRRPGRWTTSAASSSTVKNKVPVLLVNGKPAGEAFDQAAEWLRMALNPFRDEAAAREPTSSPGPRCSPTSQFADEGLGDLTALRLRLPVRRAALQPRRRRSPGGATSAAAAASSSASATAWTSAAYNDVLYRDGAGLLPARLVGKQSDNDGLYAISLRWTPSADRETALKAFRDSRPRETLLEASFHKFLQAEPAVQGGPRAVLTFAPVGAARQGPGRWLNKSGRPPGGPAILEWRPPAGKDARRAQKLRGRVVLVTTTVNADWNNWPASPVFPPFMQDAAALRRRRPAARAGRRRSAQPIELFLRQPGDRRRRRRHTRRTAARRRRRTQGLDDGGVAALGRHRRERRLPRQRRPAPAGEYLFAVNLPAAQRGAASQRERPGPHHAARTCKAPTPSGTSRSSPTSARSRTAAGVRGRRRRTNRMGASVAHVLLLVLLVLLLRRGRAGLAVRPLQRRADAGRRSGPAQPDAARWMTTRLPLYVLPWLLLVFLAVVGFVLVHNASTGDFLGFLPDGMAAAGSKRAGHRRRRPPARASRGASNTASFLWNAHPTPGCPDPVRRRNGAGACRSTSARAATSASATAFCWSACASASCCCSCWSSCRS